jgi:hypothetical protein
MDDDNPFGAENIWGAENVRGAENIEGRENTVGAENRAPDDDQKKKLAAAAADISAAADKLYAAAKVIESIGWEAVFGKAKGHPIELWGNDEALQELAARLKDIAAEMTGEAK